MKKTYLTSKNRDELNTQMDYLKSNHKNHRMEKELYPIWFVKNDKIRVDSGRTTTYWKLDFENHGVITVKRCMIFNDWLLVITLAVIDVIIAYLIIYGRGVTIAGIGLWLGLVLLQVLPLYYLYVTSPLKKITRWFKFLSEYEIEKFN